MEKKRILLKVAYEGTEYCGWQIQPNGPTIEGILNQELSRLLKTEIKVIGASRTDAGVHAMGNIAVFDTVSRIPGEKFSFALNQSLPVDIRIQKSMEVPSDFHPRHQNTIKTYEYQIYNHTFENPLYRRYTWFVHGPLDLDAMKKAAKYIVGTHDFKSFCNVHTQVEDTVRTVYACELVQEGPLYKIRITGNGFLYNMVRIIAGTLEEVGRGVYEPEALQKMLTEENRCVAGRTAPAKGLRLVEIKYEDYPEI